MIPTPKFWFPKQHIVQNSTITKIYCRATHVITIRGKRLLKNNQNETLGYTRKEKKKKTNLLIFHFHPGITINNGNVFNLK